MADKDTTFLFRLPEGLKREAIRVAKEHGDKLSVVLREALESYIKSKKN